MAFGECGNQAPSCPYAPDCYSDEHHQYYPKNEYPTPVEKLFRNLGENTVQLCRWEHDQEHKLEPPEKPPLEDMIDAIESSEQHICRSARQQIKEYRHG